jgi:hypothetical protein
MLEINEKDTFMLTDNIFLQKINELGKYWAFNIDTGEHYSLNETSYWILEKLNDNLPVKNIINNFLDNFDVDKKQGNNDFNKIVINFLEEGIIKRREKDEKE